LIGRRRRGCDSKLRSGVLWHPYDDIGEPVPRKPINADVVLEGETRIVVTTFDDGEIVRSGRSEDR